MPVDLGPIGLWTSVLDQQPATRARELAAELEEQGWGGVWIPEAVLRDPLVHAALLLDSTERLVVATGIANIYARTPMAMNNGWQSLSEAFPNRFLLGLGVSHQPLVEGLFRGVVRPAPDRDARLPRRDGRGRYSCAGTPGAAASACSQHSARRCSSSRATRPTARIRTSITPEHTALAREILGPGRVLAPEQKVVLETDPDAARAIARQTSRYTSPASPTT